MPHDQPAEKHHHQTLKFPDKFLWGAATSSFQVEGNNTNADWWHWEQKALSPSKRSGTAADQYNLFEKDFQMAADLGHNAHRTSIEWSRIEPREGEFNQQEIEHYKQVLKSLKDKKMTVMLTLWHFTLPQWLAEKGGWNNGQTIDYFLKFVQRVVPELKEYVDIWITLNEPNIYVFQTCSNGEWPGGKKGVWNQFHMMWNLAQAHKKVYRYLKQENPRQKVGIANNVQSYNPYHLHSITEQLAATGADFMGNHLIYTLTGKTHDFLGVNYYFHNRIRHFSFMDILKRNPVEDSIGFEDKQHEVSDLGWEVYPEGIFDVLTDISNDLPIYITECGIASTNDDRRTRFLLNYLSEVYRAIEAGVKVEGFFYWSLLDNYEWHRGFDPRFGLMSVDYDSQKRTVRKSALVYKEIIKHNGIPHHLLKLLAHGLSTSEIEQIIATD